MTINPQTIKQLIQLDTLRTLDVLTSGSSATAGSDESGIDFNNLLMQMLGGPDSSGAADLPTDGTDVLAQLKPLEAYSAQAQAMALAAGAGAADSAAGAYGAESSKPSRYEELIAGAAAKYGVDASLIKGVIEAESGFRPDAVSSAGAKGLMQLMDGTAQGLGVSDAFDPQQNIEGGTRYLSYLLRKFGGSEPVALAAYNAGPGRIDKLGIGNEADLLGNLDLLPAETQRYVGKVMDAKTKYSQ